MRKHLTEAPVKVSQLNTKQVDVYNSKDDQQALVQVQHASFGYILSLYLHFFIQKKDFHYYDI